MQFCQTVGRHLKKEMGLDITHYKATLELPKNSELINIGGEIRGMFGAETRESFSDFNVPFEHFKNFIQAIDCPIIMETVIIVEEKNDIEYVNNHFSSTDYKILLNDNSLNRNLKAYESGKGLNDSKRHFGESVLNKWKVLNYYKIEKREGFYYHQVAYQRKGMNENLWKRFCNNDIYEYALKSDFEYANKCVSRKKPYEPKADFELRKESFKKEFLDNYENGTSFMSVSY
ncbi:hypothetical protein SAMN05216480_11283 [Pustulibacterium marinum]|uniref:Uncharacterized protein n=1 Tax=Pustulibacterium marinum TaxID=1224947 RepID=A0A1I7I215_9FLAO|nr:hypothetical protein [Pustulibacterium marinum]SFU66983.1 hypothetical protein SAMN05216480_11283 [Pustulibacterium marinum]